MSTADRQPDIEVFFPWEGGYEDAKLWALEHGLCWRNDLSGIIHCVDQRILSAVIEIYFE